MKRNFKLALIFYALVVSGLCHAKSLQNIYQYSLKSHLIVSIKHGNATVKLQHNLIGKVIWESHTFGNAKPYKNHYKYDMHNSLLINKQYSPKFSIKYIYSLGGIAVITAPKFKSSYRYSTLGQVQTINRQGGFRTFNQFNTVGKLSNIKIGDKANYHYDFNPAGNTLSMKIDNKMLDKYEYNDHNQLIGFNSSHKDQSRIYKYGLNSNITSIFIYARPTGGLAKRYLYNLNSGFPNRLLTVSSRNYPGHFYHYNPAGDITQDPKNGIYSYNSLNQLITYHPNANININYQYGANGLLAYENQNNQKPLLFYYSKNGRLEGQQQNGTQAFYLHGLATFMSLRGASLRGNLTHTSTSPTLLYAVRQGNIALTSQNGIITNRYLYTPYGTQTDSITHKSNRADTKTRPYSLNENHFGYTGQQLDPKTHWIMLGGFRNYNPKLARFIQPDSYNTFSKPGVYNRFAYVQDNPLAYTDPTGHTTVISEADFDNFWEKRQIRSIRVYKNNYLPELNKLPEEEKQYVLQQANRLHDAMTEKQRQDLEDKIAKKMSSSASQQSSLMPTPAPSLSTFDNDKLMTFYNNFPNLDTEPGRQIPRQVQDAVSSYISDKASAYPHEIKLLSQMYPAHYWQISFKREEFNPENMSHVRAKEHDSTANIFTITVARKHKNNSSDYGIITLICQDNLSSENDNK